MGVGTGLLKHIFSLCLNRWSERFAVSAKSQFNGNLKQFVLSALSGCEDCSCSLHP